MMAQDNQPELQVEGWLKTLGIESLFLWDMLVFLDRHPSILVKTDQFALFLGHETVEVVAALDSLESSGLVERSRVSQGVRLYQLTAPADPARREAFERLLAAAEGHTVRQFLARRLRGSNRPDQKKNDSLLHGVKGSEHD